jgi:predicted DNA-binding transcriptional regulator AlpA
MELLKDKDVAVMLSVTRQTVWRWSITIEEFPAPVRIGQDSPRWVKSEIEAYVRGLHSKSYEAAPNHEAAQ